jgi:glycosyltransferase involved in cell wall biosynthesis
MWKIYGRDKLGIAIKTKINLLKEAFKESEQTIKIGEVQYYDLENIKPQWILHNPYFTFISKPNYYSDEKEVRCLFEIHKNKNLENRVKVSLNSLIEEVYISRFAYEKGLLDILEFLKEKYELSFEIRVSGMNDKML